jgi:hypothetical protein
MQRRLVILVLAFGLVLSACQSPTSVPTAAGGAATPVPTVDLAQKPEPGKATAIGRIMTHGTNQPYANVIVRLAEVVDLGTAEEDAFALDETNSPGTVSDEQGYFAFSSIEPGDYVLIFGNISTIYVIPTSTPDHAIVVQLTQDQVTDIGELQIQFPN